VYCDFKPDNVIQTEEQLKLIDMGGVRGVDSEGPIYGTVGYQAPEIGTDGPSVSSDLFTVARALAVLTFEFKGYQSSYKFTFPDGVPLLEQQESFARLLRRATHSDPGRRFGSAGEMAEQLTGVLREVLATADGVPRPFFSTVFSPEVDAVLTRGDDPPQTPPAPGGTHPPRPPLGGIRFAAPTGAEVVAGLPLPLVDRADPAAGYLATFAGLAPDQRVAALTQAVTGDPAVPQQVTESTETRLALIRARIDAGEYDAVAGLLADLAAEDPSDWRIAWYHGLRGLALAQDARDVFRAVFDELPGEVAPKLALAFAAEAAGDIAAAGHYFRLVWTVDTSYTSAAFGLARTCLASGDRPGAIAALAGVPSNSSHHAAAQVAAVRILVSGGTPGHVSPDDLRQADGRLGQLVVDDVRRQQLTVEILRAALDWCATGQPAGNGPILGCEPNARALRFGLERSYRALARLTPDEDRRIELVDLANAIRPRTLT
jgi:serine/threonine-protein kinase PknG